MDEGGRDGPPLTLYLLDLSVIPAELAVQWGAGQIRSDGSEVVVFLRPKPLHQLWYHDDTYMGVWRGPEVPPDHDFHYHRWDVRGRVLENLAGEVLI